MSRVAQFTQLKLKYDNLLSANEEDQANLVLEEMDCIFEAAPEVEREVIRSTFNYTSRL